MPWSKDDVPPSAKNFSEHCREVFARVANASLKNGDDDQRAVQNGMAAAVNCRDAEKNK